MASSAANITTHRWCNARPRGRAGCKRTRVVQKSAGAGRCGGVSGVCHLFILDCFLDMLQRLPCVVAHLVPAQPLDKELLGTWTSWCNGEVLVRCKIQGVRCATQLVVSGREWADTFADSFL
eukprot:scaffold9862_cov118-Isochrysis_galbana.AAC.3